MGGNDSLDNVAWGQRVYWDVMSRYFKEKRPSSNRTMMMGCFESKHPSNHRTPVWWTGNSKYTELKDAVRDEINGGLQFKPYVHPDCTGHHGADEKPGVNYPPEVYARWVQFCSMGTIYRIHSSRYSKGRQPWKMGNHVESIMRNFTNMRYKLIPTLIAAGKKATSTGLPLVRRLDLEWPAEEQASRNDQYLLADDLLVAPIDPFVDVEDPAHGPYNRKRDVYLPPGTWIDAFTGEKHQGNQTISVDTPLEVMPLYHRAGGMIITLANHHNPLSTVDLDWNQCVLDVFPLPSTIMLDGASNQPFTIMRSLFDSSGKSQRTDITKTELHGLLILHFSTKKQSNTKKMWTIRIHLPHSINSDAVSLQIDGNSSEQPIAILKPSDTKYIMPFDGPGKPAAPKEGAIIEVNVNDVAESTNYTFKFPQSIASH